MSTKIHHLADGKGRPLVVLVAPGQSGDSPMFALLLEQLVVGRRTRPDAVRGDKAYSSRTNRALLRERRIRAVIPEPSDQIGHRHRRGSRGGRPPAFDRNDYRNRNTVERSFCDLKQWRGLATRYDKHAVNYRGGAIVRAITIWLRQ